MSLCLVFSSSATSSNTTAFFFFFNDTATPEIYTLSPHDALPIYLDELRAGEREERHVGLARHRARQEGLSGARRADEEHPLRNAATETLVLLRCPEEVHDLDQDRKSTRLNSSHSQISYAVFCLKQ